MPWDNQIFETPVTDATGNFLDRWIEHDPSTTGAIMLAVVALPFPAIKPVTAKNKFTLDAYPNHFLALPLLCKLANIMPVREIVLVPLHLLSAYLY